MSAAINVVCYKWKTLANGESPLMVRVAKGGKRTMQSSKFYHHHKNGANILLQKQRLYSVRTVS